MDRDQELARVRKQLEDERKAHAATKKEFAQHRGVTELTLVFMDDGRLSPRVARQAARIVGDQAEVSEDGAVSGTVGGKRVYTAEGAVSAFLKANEHFRRAQGEDVASRDSARASRKEEEPASLGRPIDLISKGLKAEFDNAASR